MKKILSLLIITILSITLVACTDDTVECDDTEELVEGVCVIKEIPVIIGLAATTADDELIEGETSMITITTNDELGVTYQSTDVSIVTVAIDGTVTAVGAGTAAITVTSKTDDTKSASVSFTVAKLITLSATDTEITLKETDTMTIAFESNDEVSFVSTNQDIFVVDDAGMITAKAYGTAYLVITSTVDNTKEVSVKVIVRKLINLDVTTENVVFIVGDDLITVYESNEDVSFSSSDGTIVDVSTTGVLSAKTAGSAVITVTSTYDDTVYEEFTVTVYNVTTSLEISGTNLINIGMSTQLSIFVSPENAFDIVVWESANESVATVDEVGVVTAHAKGVVSIVAKSALYDSVFDTFEMEVLNIIVVDGTKVAGDTLTYLDVELEFGINLFADIDSAINIAEEDSVIFVFGGTYTGDIDIDVMGITLLTEEDAVITGGITLGADDITIDGFVFQGDASIMNDSTIANFRFTNNNINTLTANADAFIMLSSVSNIHIDLNDFDSALNDFVSIEDYLDGDILVVKNNIVNADNAISIMAISEYALTTTVKVVRNTIGCVNGGIYITKTYGGVEKDILAYARFNAVLAYVNYAAKSSIVNTIDFTLNYWGTDTLDMSKFINVSESYSRGYYPTQASITTEAAVRVDVPIIIELTNPLDEMMIGDAYALIYSVLPMEMNTTKIKFITSNPDVLGTDKYGNLSAYKSGNATITIRSSIDFGVNVTVSVKVTTFPGIELSSDHVENDIVIGDTFTITATPFPIEVEDANVLFSSSNELVATIDANGLVTAIGAGLVFLTATLEDDVTVSTVYTLNVYASLDASNLLDYLTMNQVGYATPHKWTAFGFQYNYSDFRYESVSRYYFDNVVINQTKMVPVSYGIRPGELMDPLTTVTPYNSDNIHWVVVHDTASSSTGSGALAHANYLYNAAIAENPLWVSWHYTIDDTFIYQHLPENERGYHAGDGSTNPGTSSTYFGGGNRNGVGIEMSINDDGDMYRTWQRTAKLVADILIRNDLPRTQMAYHNDFSGKDCPNTLRNAGLIPLFEIFADVEYKVKDEFAGATILFESNDLDYLDNNGRIIDLPDRSMTVSYTITVTDNGVTSSRTFYTYLPGTVK